MDTKALFEKLQTGRSELKAWIDTKGGFTAMTSDDLVEFNNRNDELNDLGAKHQAACAAEQQQKAFEDGNKPDTTTAPYDPGNGKPNAGTKSIGERFVESAQYKGRAKDGVSAFDMPDVDVKTLMTTSANGFPPEVTRNGDIVPLPHRNLVVSDLLSVRPTDQITVRIMTQTVLTNNAAERAEGAAAAESVLTWAPADFPVRSVATYIPVTDEELEDEAGLAALIDQELGYMVLSKLDAQILVGTGAGVTLTGLLAGANTQAKGADDVFSAIGKGILTIQSSEYTGATACVMNPTDYWGARLLRTAEGIYIMGNPDEVGATRMFGAPIVQTTALTAGTALVGDFGTGAYLAYRRGLTVDVGFQNDDFVKFQKSIRANIRVALPIRRAHMFTKVTGL